MVGVNCSDQFFVETMFEFVCKFRNENRPSFGTKITESYPKNEVYSILGMFGS